MGRRVQQLGDRNFVIEAYVITVIDGRNYRTPMSTTYHAKVFAARVKEHFGEDTPVHICPRDAANGGPPEDLKRTPGYIWCPYCREERKFRKSERTGYLHCSICSISDNDYYVKLYNGGFYPSRRRKKGE